MARFALLYISRPFDVRSSGGWRVALALLCAFALTPRTTAAQTTLTLDDAMSRARADTVEARALASSIAEADARIRQARAGFWPRIDLSEMVQRGNQPVYVFGSLLSQRRFSEANFAIAALNRPEPLTNTRTALAVEQPVFDAGLARLAVRSAGLQRDAATAERDRTTQDLAFRAAEAFVRVLQLDAAIRATDAAVAAAQSDLERARARRDAGLVTEADVLAIDVHLADMRQRQIAASGELAVSRIQLADAIGLPLNTVLVPERPAPRPVGADADALVREAMKTAPQRRQAAAGEALADIARRTARAALLPTVGLQAGWEFNGATVGSQESSWIVGAEVRVNLFKGFADAARLAEARHAQARAAAERERVDRTIEVNVRAALARVTAARAREDAGRAALAQARESQRIIRDRYEGGLATATDMLRAAEATLDAESRATAAETDVILQTIALDRALGRL